MENKEQDSGVGSGGEFKTSLNPEDSSSAPKENTMVDTENQNEGVIEGTNKKLYDEDLPSSTSRPNSPENKDLSVEQMETISQPNEEPPVSSNSDLPNDRANLVQDKHDDIQHNLVSNKEINSENDNFSVDNIHSDEGNGLQNCLITDVRTGDCESIENDNDEEMKGIEEDLVDGVSQNDNEGLPIDNDNHNADPQDNINETNEVAEEIEKKKVLNESAFKKLASLGVIAPEEPIVETKESALMKLASRGAISITPAGGGSPVPTVSGSVSITQTSNNTSNLTSTPTKATSTPKYRPGPKSKKLKIDPGKSMDIDKDFNSLINFLSAGNSEEPSPASVQVQKTSPVPESIDNENASKLTSNQNVSSENLFEIAPEPDLDINDTCMDQDLSDSVNVERDESSNQVDEEVVHETGLQSHDETIAPSHSSDIVEESNEVNLVQETILKPKTVIEEGSTEILLSATKNVFYNKVQEFNRDMSIAALNVFSEMHQQDPRTRNRGKKRKSMNTSDSETNCATEEERCVFEPGKKSENGITILEALSATGLRSIRYALEVPGVKEVIANDLSEDAVETIEKNIKHNGVEDLVSTTMSDASMLMYQRQAKQESYDAIDLDPYGCPARFLDSAVQAVADGGLLLVTCTDMAVLAGNSPETCYVKYGAVSLRSPSCHEMALRIALQCIESHANRYGRYIVPLLSFSADFYIRLIVQVYTSPVTCKRTTSKLSMVYQCVGCHTHTLQPLGLTTQPGSNVQPKHSLCPAPPVDSTCYNCHYKHHMGGPIWSAPIYSQKFVESMLRVVENGRFGTSKRMQGMLEVIREELPDIPLYYTISGLCTKLHCQAIPLIDIRSAILNAGYRVSSSHAAPTAIKTNAPSKLIWDIMRCWVHMNPVSQKRLINGSVAEAVIQEPPITIANFDIHPKARPSSSMRKLLRYQPNPEKNWGPGTRARCNASDDDDRDEKRRLNQNKNKNKTGKKHIEIIEVVTIDDEDEVACSSAT